MIPAQGRPAHSLPMPPCWHRLARSYTHNQTLRKADSSRHACACLGSAACPDGLLKCIPKSENLDSKPQSCPLWLLAHITGALPHVLSHLSSFLSPYPSPPSPPWAHCCLQQLLDFTYLGSPLACCLSTSLVELLGKLEPLTPAPPPKENHPPGYRHAPPPQKNPFCVCSLPQLEVHVLHKSDWILPK